MRWFNPLPLLLTAFALGASALAMAEVNHALFDSVLKAHVKDGQVNYPAVAADKNFAAYLQEIANTKPPASKPDKLTYYMNAYNAVIMKGILDGKSPSSFFGRQSFFKRTTFKVGGEDVTPDHLEHQVLRKLDEPRIHFSIVCASTSCPKIRNDAFTVDKLESQLDENARGFVNDSTRNRFDKKAKIAYLSQIFKWFEEDFVKNAGSVQKYIAKYVKDPEVAKELANDGYTIKYNDYDWNLNGTPPGKG
jgi:hypothetical protein